MCKWKHHGDNLTKSQSRQAAGDGQDGRKGNGKDNSLQSRVLWLLFSPFVVVSLTKSIRESQTKDDDDDDDGATRFPEHERTRHNIPQRSDKVKFQVPSIIVLYSKYCTVQWVKAVGNVLKFVNYMGY